MSENKNQLVLGFLILGVLLVGLSTYFSLFSAKKPAHELRLARIDRETGKVFVLRSGYTQRQNVTQKTDIYNLDSIETMETGEAIVAFESAFRVRLFNNTLVTLERIDNPQEMRVVLIVKRGEVRVESTGRSDELFIAKNGQRVPASEYNNSQLAQAPTQPLQPNEAFSNPVPANQGLSEEEINTVISNHRSSFFKCYTQLLQKEPSAKGNVSLSFTIENNGKLSVAEVTASQMQNEEFKRCLLEVLRRIEFRSFQGPAISTLFPLKFE